MAVDDYLGEAVATTYDNAAAHLEPGGSFVVEVMVPELRRLPPGDSMRVVGSTDASWGIDEDDVASRGLVPHHFEAIDGRLERRSIPYRSLWPSGLDLVAELAGLRLRERWGGWRHEAFTTDSRRHVSVREKPVDQPSRAPDPQQRHRCSSGSASVAVATGCQDRAITARGEP